MDININRRSTDTALCRFLKKMIHSQNSIAISLVALGLFFSALVLFMPEQLEDRWLAVCNNVITAGIALFSVHMTPDTIGRRNDDPK